MTSSTPGGPRLRREPISYSEMGRALAMLRVSTSKTQAALAAASGVHPAAVSEYECGKKMPEMNTIVRLIDALGYGLEDLDEALVFVRQLHRAPAELESDPRVRRSEAVRVANGLGRYVTLVAMQLL